MPKAQTSWSTPGFVRAHCGPPAPPGHTAVMDKGATNTMASSGAAGCRNGDSHGLGHILWRKVS